MTVVTRDRVNCLNKFLHLASNQTLKPTNILVVDNDSKLETKLLVEKYITGNPSIIYLNTKRNGGSAGGQSIALTYAASNGYDLVYTLDDDCEPELNALENVYNKWLCEKDRENTVLSSIALSLTSDEFSFALWKLKRNIFSSGNSSYWSLNQIPKNEIVNDVFYGWSHFFLGVLIPVSLIKKHGSVNTKYFIRGDELEYFIRLRELGVKLGAVTTSIIRHPQELQGQTNDLKLYYTLRNNTEIRVKYYPSWKYNKPFFKIWLLGFKFLGKSKNITYQAVYDAINEDFSKLPEDVLKGL
jgi:GT2 family glycosyltransferase